MRLKVTLKIRCPPSKSNVAGTSGPALDLASTKTDTSKSRREQRKSEKIG